MEYKFETFKIFNKVLTFKIVLKLSQFPCKNLTIKYFFM